MAHVTFILSFLVTVIAAQGQGVPLRPLDSQSHPAREVAERYCQSCHLFPEPELLDKQTWEQALRKMAPYVGVAVMNNSDPEKPIIDAARILPINPILSREEWIAINTYYRDTAPSAPLRGDRVNVVLELPLFKSRTLVVAEERPRISMVHIDPAKQEVIYSDGADTSLRVVNARGELLKRTALTSAATSGSFQPEGIYLTLIGNLFPTDLPVAQLAMLSGDVVKPLLTELPRTTDVQVGDLNGDDLNDFVLSIFGNRIGLFSWFERRNGRMDEHVLLDRPGAVRSHIVDLSGDKKPDIVVVMGQAREGVVAFVNDGLGDFEMHELAPRHPLFGYADLQVADFNGDGLPDLLTANGDNGEYPSCFKNYHGLRIHLNRGAMRFEERHFHPMDGAFRTVARDFDQDGDMDIAAVSFFPDYARGANEGFVYLENVGNLKFKARTFPEAAHGRWIVLDAGDVDGDGDADIVLGSFPAGPVSVPIPPPVQQIWQQKRVGLMLLENTLKSAAQR